MKHLNDLGVEAILCNRWRETIESIESAFLDPTADMVPKIYLDCKGGNFRAMPAALKCYASLKWIGVFPNNWQIPIPTTQGTLILSDRETGSTLMTMDCTRLTAYRTAATSAIAAKHCAPNAKEFAFIGCGLQAKYHIEAYEAVFGHMNMSVELYDTNESSMFQMFNWIGRENLCNAWGRNKSVKQAVKHADVITTLTPSTVPYLDILDLKSNCHINAVGADAKGKRELMTNIIDGSANIICDDPMQALHSGELQYNEWPHLDVNSMEYLIKNHKTMQLDKGVSVFDSTGVGIEDIATALLVYANYDKSFGR
jgi:alanine dehydrogenase